jgi:hypothetical protein
MGTQEMLNRLLTKMDANNKTMLAEIKADKEERKAGKEEMLAAIRANEEMTARMDAKIGSMHDELKKHH